MTTTFELQATRGKAAQDLPTRFMDLLNHCGLALMISLGHRTGLFDTMATLDWSTSTQIAQAAGLSERYVREWLGAMTTGHIVDHDPESRTYKLPEEHARWLTRAATPNNLAVAAQWVAVLGSVEDEVAAAFRHGKGVPYSAYKDFHRVMAEESGQTVVGALEGFILPLVPEVIARLEEGIEAVDVGCGAGRAVMEMARLFPKSRFTGIDFSHEAIDLATREAARRGIGNVRFHVQDAATWHAPASADFITTFDAVHDQADPAAALKNIYTSLRPGGTYLMQDILASSHHHTDIDHPVGPFIYCISTMHCMSVSLANNGAGLGAAWGKETALQMLREAGFKETRVETLAHDVMNYYYISRKP
jgi:ubiquinone/menaquinone biosynthesis C-methylase UbiE